MKEGNLKYLFFILFFSSFASASPSCPCQVTPQIIRGPRIAISTIKRLGVKTIINLQGMDTPPVSWFEPGEKLSVINAEMEGARKEGMNFVSAALSSTKEVDYSEQQKIEAVLKYMNDPSLWPIYIHCEHGKDRTGLIVALYRVRFQKWSKADAHKEWEFYGHDWFSRILTNNLDEYFFQQ